jgi:hypothetical protein
MAVPGVIAGAGAGATGASAGLFLLHALSASKSDMVRSAERFILFPCCEIDEITCYLNSTSPIILHYRANSMRESYENFKSRHARMVFLSANEQINMDSLSR